MNLSLKIINREILNAATGCETIYYVLYLGDTEISHYMVNIRRKLGGATIEYNNVHINDPDGESYVGKGYTTEGLKMVCDDLFSRNLVTEIGLDISTPNLFSQKAAEKAGFIKDREDSYFKLHPDAELLITTAMEEHKDDSNKMEVLRVQYKNIQYERSIEEKSIAERERIK